MFYFSRDVLSSVKNFQLPPYSFSPVDVERFTGLWYEVAKSPNQFERGCDYATAEYLAPSSNPNALFDVVNTCYQGNQPTRTVRGYAKATVIPFAFSVVFPPMSGVLTLLPNYIVAWVSKEYERAVIITPIGNVWFLSRTKHISEEEYEEMLSYVPFPSWRARVVRNQIL